MSARDDAIKAGERALDLSNEAWDIYSAVAARVVVDIAESIIRADERERIAQALLEKLTTYHHSEPDECGHRSLVLHGPDEIRRDAAAIARGEQP